MICICILWILFISYTKSNPTSLTECGNLTVTSQTVYEGNLVTFTMKTPKNISLTWERDIIKGFVKEEDNGIHYFINQIDSVTTYFTIKKASVTDTGSYRVRCQLENGVVYSNVIKLRIVRPPSKPVFEGLEKVDTCEKCISARIGEAVDVKCSTENGTDPILTMFKNGKELSEVDMILGENGYKLTANYKFRPNSTDDIHTYFTCKVNNRNVTSDSLMTNASLYLKIPPTAAVIDVPMVIKEDTKQTITCMTYGGRPPYMPDFIFNSNTLNGTKKRTKILVDDTYNVTTTLQTVFERNDNLKIIKCGWNTKYFHVMSTNKTVHVLFPPRSANFTEVTKDNKKNGETRLVLRLKVDASNPRSDFKWIGVEKMDATFKQHYSADSNTKGEILIVEMTMNLTYVDNKHHLEVLISNKEFPDSYISMKYPLDIKYHPIVTIEGSNGGNMTVYNADDVTLICNIDSNPSPARVTWYQGASALKETTNRLTLYNVTYTSDLMYTCNAENSQGIGTDTITLVVKEKPLIGENNEVTSFPTGPVVGGIIVALIAIAIGLGCLYKKKKGQNPDENNYSINIEDRKQSTNLNPNEPLYAIVKKQNGRTKDDSMMKTEGDPNDQHPTDKDKVLPVTNTNGTRNEDGLLYAELDLMDVKPSTSRSVIIEDDATQYVTVDFNKTKHLDVVEQDGDHDNDV